MKFYKHFIVVFMLFFTAGEITFAQDSVLIKWSTLINKKSEKEYELVFKGIIPKGYHIYSADSAEGLSGFQSVINDSNVKSISISIEAGNKNINDPIFENKEKQVFENEITVRQIIGSTKDLPPVLKTVLTYELGDAQNFIPEEQSIRIELQKSTASETRILIPSIEINNPVSDCGLKNKETENTANQSLWRLFLIGFLGGLVALLTPCVFPMIPLTVSFFTKKATSKKQGIFNAFLYGFFIFFIYILLSLPFHFLDSINPEFLNNISTNVYLNVTFFIVFLFFAFSFFGFYEITLPASFSSGADSKAGVGNVIGIFFMALTLALVSFSCTGPILGSLLAGSLASDDGAMQLTAGMGGFGLALALPFALFALFPNWLNSLPKSGGWLNTVKVVLGFLELGLAFKFLSNADLVKHWGLLKREIFIGIWILVGAALTVYLFGKIRFSHDTPNQKISKGRKSLAIIVGIFTLYLIPGLTNTSYANLSLISGFPPPLYYSIYAHESDCVLGLNCTKNYEEGLALARKENKPVLLDFTGYACVNCRRMEENVWSDPEIFKTMKSDFIVVSLYVDDKKELPVEKQFVYKTKQGDSKEINTWGDLWSTMQTENFANNSQPWYAIINSDEILLNSPVGYTPDKNEYLKWLKCGLEAFKKNKTSRYLKNIKPTL